MEFKTSHEDHEDESGAMADINIVPLVDVMLVLLIIFMVTAPLSIGGITINLPSSKARASQVSDENRVVLSINVKGDYFIEKVGIPGEVLETRLAEIYANREKKEIYIRADKAVVYEKVVNAMSAARLAGVTKISMLTEAKMPARK
ncbi:MAG: ExbD/TolR family protein [Proteobacteria bacterium]|nr:MAG: ExbD/TolR family protein [Pseudomonadota bacterium]